MRKNFSGCCEWIQDQTKSFEGGARVRATGTRHSCCLAPYILTENFEPTFFGVLPKRDELHVGTLLLCGNSRVDRCGLQLSPLPIKLSRS